MLHRTTNAEYSIVRQEDDNGFRDKTLLFELCHFRRAAQLVQRLEQLGEIGFAHQRGLRRQEIAEQRRDGGIGAESGRRGSSPGRDRFAASLATALTPSSQ